MVGVAALLEQYAANREPIERIAKGVIVLPNDLPTILSMSCFIMAMLKHRDVARAGGQNFAEN